jgi:hypothetical protein
MNKIEFNTFVQEQLQGRWPKWQATAAMLEDWYDALRCHGVAAAVTAVKSHRLSAAASIFEPKINEVVKLLPPSRRDSDTQQPGPVYVPWVRCLDAPPDHPKWINFEWLRSEYCFSGLSNRRAHVAQAADRAACDIQMRHGGRWCGVVRPEGQAPPCVADFDGLPGPEARECVRRHILDGPDGPGRRFLLGRCRSHPMSASSAETDAPPQPLTPEPCERQDDLEFFASHPVEQDEIWERG